MGELLRLAGLTGRDLKEQPCGGRPTGAVIFIGLLFGCEVTLAASLDS